MAELRTLVVAEVELVILHVFTRGTVPRTLERPARDPSIWVQDTSPGHAAVIRDVLAVSTVPVLLLPIDRLAGQGRTTTTGQCACAETA